MRKPKTTNINTSLFLTDDIHKHNAVTRHAEATGGIVAVHGPSGTGKSASSRYLTRNSDYTWIPIELDPKSTSKQTVENLHHALTGTYPSGRGVDIRRRLITRLSNDDICLFVDEAPYGGIDGLQALRSIADGVEEETGQPMTMMIAGSNLPRVLLRAPELEDRVTAWVEFSSLTDPDEILAFAAHLSPRFAASPDDDLLNLNKTVLSGTFRKWIQAASLAESRILFPGSDPLTKGDFETIQDVLTRKRVKRAA